MPPVAHVKKGVFIMNILKKTVGMLCVGALSTLAYASCDSGPSIASPYFSIRSQGRDAVIQMIGTVGHIHDYCNDPFRLTFAITPEYTKSFNPNDITRCLFGPDVVSRGTNCNDDISCIRIQGSNVANRDERAWLADYFYLPPDFESTICFEPRIKNFLVNLDKFVNLDICMPGLYFRLYGPIVWTNWDLNFCETISQRGTNSFPAGYFGPEAITRNNLLTDFSAYIAGGAPQPFGDLLFNGLHYARIDCEDHTAAGFAELRAEFGWDYWHDACNHFGFNVQAAAPTGKRPKACRVFEPMIGNGHHWELGAGFSGHHLFYLCSENDRAVGFYYDVNLTHLFGTKQRRTFDLCDRPNSRYMLAERLGKPVSLLIGTSGDAGVDPDFQFKNEYTPVANLTTLDVHVSAALQADIVAMFNFCFCNWSVDVGYNFWMRSSENIHPRDARGFDECEAPSLCDPRNLKTWALKGDARVYGFVGNAETLPADTPVALSATQSKATIHSGLNALGTSQDRLINAIIDNAELAFAIGDSFLVFEPGASSLVAANLIRTSIQPVLLECNDIDFHGTKGLSHKVFAHMSYTWWDHDCWVPFIGFGGFGEFGKSESKGSTRSSVTGCVSCPDNVKTPTCALSQWGVWLKGGISY